MKENKITNSSYHQPNTPVRHPKIVPIAVLLTWLRIRLIVRRKLVQASERRESLLPRFLVPQLPQSPLACTVSLVLGAHYLTGEFYKLHLNILQSLCSVVTTTGTYQVFSLSGFFFVSVCFPLGCIFPRSARGLVLRAT